MALDFFEQFRQNVERFPEQTALQIIREGQREVFTFRRIAEEISKIGLFLQRSGLEPGTAVGILMENHPRWGIAFLAAQSAGAKIVPFDVLHDPSTLAWLIQHAECRYLIASTALQDKLQQVLECLDNPPPVLLCSTCGGDSPWDEALLQIREQPVFPLVRREPDEDFLIIYTSGTTGNPKGVVLSQRNIYRTIEEVLKVIHASAEDHILSVLPLYHMLALMANFIIPLYVGARVTYLDSLEPQRLLRAFTEEGITIFVCVPQFYYLIHRRILQQVEKQPPLRRWAFRRLLQVSRMCNRRFRVNPGRLFFRAVHRPFGPQFRLFAVGGARFDPEVAEFFQLLGFQLVQAYGMTETSAVTTVTPIGKGIGSVGRPLPHCRIRIQEPDQRGIGEILIQGENIMKGYWKNPEATAEVLRQGWLHSGDLGYLDRQGFLHITGRKKDVIVLSSGKNIFPEELEQFYQKHCPFIQEICVVGIPEQGSEAGQEKLHAVIVPDFEQLKAQQVVNAYDMIRYTLENLSQKLPDHKRVRSFQIRREPLPRTTTRKIKRFQVQREILEGAPARPEKAPAQAAEPADWVEERIFDLVRRLKKVEAIHPAMNLELDLGFDSLGRVEFLSTIQEAFQIRIDDDEAVQIFTLQDLAEKVRGHLSGESKGSGLEARSWTEILSDPLQEEDRQKVEEILRPRPLIEVTYYLLSRVIRVLGLLLFRLRFEGLDHLPRQYPFLICPNHLSYLDAFLLVSGLPFRIIRRLFFLGYSDYFSGPVTSFLGRWVKTIPVDPDRHLRQALRLGAEGLRRGLVLCVFPEGERSIDGRLKAFRKGPATLAVESGVPVVPVAILGTFQAWPRGSNRIRLHPIRIRLGAPLNPATVGGSYDEFNRRLREAVLSLLEERTETSPT